MKKFLNTIKLSFYNPEFYESVRGQTLWPVIKILVVLGALGIAISASSLAPTFWSLAHSNLPQAFENSYPDDMVVKIEEGRMSVNKPQPYYIKNTLPVLSGPGAPENLVIFDASSTLSDDIRENSTFLLVKEKYAISQGQNNSQQIISFSRSATSTIIQKNTITDDVDIIKPYFTYGVLGGGLLLGVFSVLLGSIFWVIWQMAYTLLPALLLFIFGLLRNPKLRFKENYMMALYASIPVSIFFFVLGLISVPQPSYVYTLALIAVVVFNIVKLPKDSHVEPSPAPSLPEESKKEDSVDGLN